MKTITVNLGARSYRIGVAHDRYRSLAGAVSRLGVERVGCVITNRRVRRLAGRPVLSALRRAGWTLTLIDVPDTERAKSLPVMRQVIRRIAATSTQHVPTLFALGGGVVGDLTGFVASTYRRGIPYIQLPTSLLAQVDSAIGGKVGVDLPEGKNLLGAMYQPQLVWSDTSVLRTLPRRQLITGLAEVLKYGAIMDPTLWRRLTRRRAPLVRGKTQELTWVVARCAAIKARVVEHDERETAGLRTLLNFGHTVGHAIEAATQYTRYTHGEAIAIGMAAALDVGVALDVTPPAVRAAVMAQLHAYGLPTHATRLSARRVLRALAFDKKFLRGQQRWVVLRGIGHASVVHGVEPSLVQRIVADRV